MDTGKEGRRRGGEEAQRGGGWSLSERTPRTWPRILLPCHGLRRVVLTAEQDAGTAGSRSGEEGGERVALVSCPVLS
eukprot:748916-Hanusia_phi.AAC.1